MSAGTTALASQREVLRDQLIAHRQIIEQLLGSSGFGKAAYPRSITMRFLTHRSTKVSTILLRAAASVIGSRIFKSAPSMFALPRWV
jgi:hypothetical protein